MEEWSGANIYEYIPLWILTTSPPKSNFLDEELWIEEEVGLLGIPCILSRELDTVVDPLFVSGNEAPPLAYVESKSESNYICKNE